MRDEAKCVEADGPGAAAPLRSLSLFDALCVIVGIIVGAGIYETAPTVARCMGGWSGTMGIWLAGGLLALSGALCYAELAACFPHQGGDYCYLGRAYGPAAGFLFGWVQLAVVRPGDIALMAFVFARYAGTLYPFPGSGVVYAAGAVVVLTAVNVLGVRSGARTQNLLTAAKALGLLGVVAAGLLAPAASPAPAATPAAVPDLAGIQLALILVLFTYGGWNEMAYVAAEVRRPERNIARALVFGTMAVIVLYLLANAAFLRALGPDGMAASKAVAADTLARRLPGSAPRVISVLICVSALGAVNGLVFTGARISYALGRDHRVFRRLGRWHPHLGVPVGALLLQGGLSLLLIFALRSFIDTILYTAPVVWLFFLATGASLFVLRRREAARPRPFRAPAYPLTPVLFCAAAAFMLYSSLTYAWAQKPGGLVVLGAVLAAGVLVYGLARGRKS